jgi:hypothetical protein
MRWEGKGQDECDYLAGGTRKVRGKKGIAGLPGKRKVCRGRYRLIISAHVVYTADKRSKHGAASEEGH